MVLCWRAGGAMLGPAPKPQHHGGEIRTKLLATHCTWRCAIAWGFAASCAGGKWGLVVSDEDDAVCQKYGLLFLLYHCC